MEKQIQQFDRSSNIVYLQNVQCLWNKVYKVVPSRPVINKRGRLYKEEITTIHTMMILAFLTVLNEAAL